MNFRNLLVFISGYAAIAYELMYFKIASVFIGNSQLVTATLLSFFILFSGIGSFLAKKKKHWLPYTEIVIGLYAIFSSLLFIKLGSGGLEALIDTLPFSKNAVQIITALIFIVTPACLVGFAIPLFSQYLDSKKESLSSAFQSVYLYYHVGGALCLVILEVFVIRYLGVATTLCLFGVLSVAVGIIIKISANTCPGSHNEEFSLRLTTKRKQVYAALIIGGIASSSVQLLIYRVTDHLLDPRIENFATVLACFIAGLAAGAALVKRYKLSYKNALALSQYSLVLTMLAIPLIGSMIVAITQTDGILFNLLCQAIIFLWTFFLAVAIGAWIPALTDESDIPAGNLLFAGSVGNFVGFWLFSLVLDNLFSEVIIICIVLIGLSLAEKLVAQGNRSLTRLVLLVPVVLLLTTPTPYYSVNALWSTMESEAPAEELSLIKVFKKNGFMASLYANGFKEKLNIMGYSSLSMNDFTQGNETFVGFAPIYYLNETQREKALVLGAGTGLTGSGAASIFNQVDLVDINPGTPEMLEYFNASNGVVNEDVNLIVTDSLSFLYATKKKYNTIISTVSGAGYYFSAQSYTKDFFELASSRLEDDGIMVIWFDERFSMEGVESVIKGYGDVFEHHEAFFFTNGYGILIGSHSPLNLRDISEDVGNITVSESTLRNLQMFINRMGLSSPDDQVNLVNVYAKNAMKLCVRRDADTQAATFNNLVVAYKYRTRFSRVADEFPLTKLSEHCISTEDNNI